MRGAGCFWPLPVLKYVESVQKIETGLERGQWLRRKLRITVSVNSRGEGEPRPKSASLICAAECFRLLQVFKGIESVRNHETGFKGGQWLLRKLRIEVATAWSRSLSRRHSDSQLSRLKLTPFEPRFVIPDRFNILQHWRRPKTSRGAHTRQQF